MEKKRQIRVYIRCVFVKIFHVDTVNEHFSAEIFLQSKWREPLLDNVKDFKSKEISKLWNPKIHIENIFKENKQTVLREVHYPDKKGTAYMIEKRRINAIFHETLELKQFPFDCQDLSIAVSTELSADEMIFVEYPNDISKLNLSVAIDSQEWDLHSHVDVEIKEVISDCNIGPEKRYTITFTCRASRRFGYFILNHMLISSMFVLLTFCSFAVISNNTHGRLQLCMIILLTSVTFKVAVSENLPKIPYLTYLDKAVLGNIFMIMCLCMWHAATSIFFYDFKTLNYITENRVLEVIRKIEMILIPSLLVFYLFSIFIFGLIIYFDAGNRRKLMKSKDIEFEKKLIKMNNEELYCDII